MSDDATQTPPVRGKPLWIALWVVLLGTLYFPVLTSLFDQWLEDSNYRHGLLVPLISGLLLYRRRGELAASRPGGGVWFGVLFIAAATVSLVAGTAADELFTTRFSLPTLLIGLTLVLMGVEFSKRAAFPLLFLYMMIPLPYIIYYKIAFPLQLMSAKLSTTFLDFLGVSVIRHGNILLLPNYSLEVVAACSGLRSLMTMATLALIIGVFGEMSVRKRFVLFLLAVPAALAANTLRLIVTGLGAYLVSPAFADGFLHNVSGIVVFFSGFLVLLLFYWIVRKV